MLYVNKILKPLAEWSQSSSWSPEVQRAAGVLPPNEILQQNRQNVEQWIRLKHSTENNAAQKTVNGVLL
jgi:hypothetical protein